MLNPRWTSIGSRFEVMAMTMEELLVREIIRACMGARNNVVDFEQVILIKEKVADRAFPLLTFEQKGFCSGDAGEPPEAGTPIDPISIKGRAARLNFDIAEMVSLSVQRENNLRVVDTSSEPNSIRGGTEPVTTATPILGFVRMATFTPSFELLEEDVVELREGILTT